MESADKLSTLARDRLFEFGARQIVRNCRATFVRICRATDCSNLALNFWCATYARNCRAVLFVGMFPPNLYVQCVARTAKMIEQFD
jgi:hypothetical protein